MNANIEEFFENLLVVCDRADTKAKLKILKSVLDNQVENRVTVFSLKFVAQQSFEAGGPSYQTIQNKTGKRYKDLFNKYVEVFSNKPKINKIKGPEDWIDEVEDTASQYKIKRMMAELKKLKAENDSLKQLNSNIVIELKNFEGGTEAIDNQNKQEKAPSLPSLLTSEIETLKELLDEEYLKSRSLSYDEKGSLIIGIEGDYYPISNRRLKMIIEKLLLVR